MTDNLRDRIAAAVQPFLFDRYDCPIPSEAREVADAVIRELQTPQPCRNCGCPLVRDWTPDV